MEIRTNQIAKLNDENYYTWSYDVEMLLSSKGLWEHCLSPTERQQQRQQYEELLRPTSILRSNFDENEQLRFTEPERIDAKWIEDDKKCMAIIGMNIETKFISIIRRSRLAY